MIKAILRDNKCQAEDEEGEDEQEDMDAELREIDPRDEVSIADSLNIGDARQSVYQDDTGRTARRLMG